MEKSNIFVLTKLDEAVAILNKIRSEVIDPSDSPEKLEDLRIKARELCYIGRLLDNELRLEVCNLKNIDSSPPYDYI